MTVTNSWSLQIANFCSTFSQIWIHPSYKCLASLKDPVQIQICSTLKLIQCLLQYLGTHGTVLVLELLIVVGARIFLMQPSFWGTVIPFRPICRPRHYVLFRIIRSWHDSSVQRSSWLSCLNTLRWNYKIRFYMKIILTQVVIITTTPTSVLISGTN